MAPRAGGRQGWAESRWTPGHEVREQLPLGRDGPAARRDVRQRGHGPGAAGGAESPSCVRPVARRFDLWSHDDGDQDATSG
jgi:hypothetical protein